MKMRKLYASGLALVMALTMAACGGNAGSDTSADYSEEVAPNYLGTFIPTFSSRSGDSYTVGLYVQGNDVIGDYSYLTDFANDGDSSVDVKDLQIDAQGSGFTAIAVQGTEETGASNVNISNVELNLSDDSDGSNACDFTGLGTAIVASGATENAHITLNIDNTTLNASGFGRDGIIVDDYADAIITNSTFTSLGGNTLPNAGLVYDGYLNTAKQAFMLSPPWILGIIGGSRVANVLGDYSSLTVVDSTMKAGAWAVLSTDDCTEPVVNSVNSELIVAKADEEGGINGGADLFGYDYNYGSGYGTYAIGDAIENFYGTTFTGVTYATILTGGNLYFGASYAGLELKNGTGDVIYTYDGEAKDTEVNGVWGIMDHQGGTATLDKGSVWNTEEAVLLKKGTNETTFNVTGAELNSKSGVIFQAMDDDDGYGATPFSSTALCLNGEEWGMPTFTSGWREQAASAGLPTAVGSRSTGGAVVTTLNLTSSEYTGDVFNGYGSGEGKDASGIAVNLDGTTLNGAISSTDTIHGMPYSEEAVAYLDSLAKEYGTGINPQGDESTYSVKYALLDKDGKVTEDKSQAAYIQFLEFTMNEVYMMGQVINFQAAGATTEVSLTNGANWNVTKDSYLTYLNVAEGCTVTIADGVTLYIDGQAYTGTIAAGTYGTQYVAGDDAGAGDMMGGPGGPGGMPGGPGGDAATDDTEAAEPVLNTANKVMLTVKKL